MLTGPRLGLPRTLCRNNKQEAACLCHCRQQLFHFVPLSASGAAAASALSLDRAPRPAAAGAAGAAAAAAHPSPACRTCMLAGIAASLSAYCVLSRHLVVPLHGVCAWRPPTALLVEGLIRGKLRGRHHRDPAGRCEATQHPAGQPATQGAMHVTPGLDAAIGKPSHIALEVQPLLRLFVFLDVAAWQSMSQPFCGVHAVLNHTPCAH